MYAPFVFYFFDCLFFFLQEINLNLSYFKSWLLVIRCLDILGFIFILEKQGYLYTVNSLVCVHFYLYLGQVSAPVEWYTKENHWCKPEYIFICNQPCVNSKTVSKWKQMNGMVLKNPFYSIWRCLHRLQYLFWWKVQFCLTFRNINQRLRLSLSICESFKRWNQSSFSILAISVLLVSVVEECNVKMVSRWLQTGMRISAQVVPVWDQRRL